MSRPEPTLKLESGGSALKVIGGARRRRWWTLHDKPRIVEETLGGSIGVGGRAPTWADAAAAGAARRVSRASKRDRSLCPGVEVPSTLQQRWQ